MSLLGAPWSPEDSALRHSPLHGMTPWEVSHHPHRPRWGRGDGPQREGLTQRHRARVTQGGTARGAVLAPRPLSAFSWSQP